MRINHSGGSYEVIATSLESASQLIASDARVITDSTVAAVAPQVLKGRAHLAVSPGEQSKSLETFGEALSWLAQSNATRKTTLVALGGGVVGDLAGFVAASYMRGIRFVQIPTTLLAMVDSSVGGKVGIDLSEGKNLAGAFKAPDAVYVPIELLRSLPARQFTNGMAEVLKYGFIMDAPLAERLRQSTLYPTHPGLEHVVMRCIQLKAEVVEEDEFETTGKRATLNFGHTIGHAIEHAYAYGKILHGEAIAIGMVLEAQLGEELGITERGTAKVVTEDIARYGLPTAIDPSLSPRDLINAMYRDKKASTGSLAFSLLTDVGRCKLVQDVPPDMVESVMARV